MTEPLVVDNSTLSAVARCSTEAVVRYSLGLATRDEKSTLQSGTAAHAAFAAYYASGDATQALDVFETSYRAWADEHVPPDDRLSFGNTSRILAAWMDAHPRHMLPFVPEHVEIGFAFPLADDVTFVGRLDAIARGRDDGHVYIVENKTTGRISPAWLSGFRTSSQLSGYIAGAREHTSQLVVGAFLVAVEFSRLPSDPTRKCKTHATAYAECGHLHAVFEMAVVQRTEEQLAEWRRTALHLTRRYQDLLRRFPALVDLHRVRQQGTFTGACTYCACRDFCQVGRPLDLVGTMFVEDRWHPLNHAMTGQTSGRKP